MQSSPKRPVGRPRGRPKSSGTKKPPTEKKKRGRKPGSKNSVRSEAAPALKVSLSIKNASSSHSALQSSPLITGDTESRTGQSLFVTMHDVPKLEPSSQHRPIVEKNSDGSLRFVEPELATPSPGISGHTLESMPPQKAKRLAIGGGRGRKPKGGGFQRFSSADDFDDDLLLSREDTYREHLLTPKSESLTDLSGLRSQIQGATRKRGRPPSKSQGVEYSPSTPRSMTNAKSSPGSRSTKRLKVISPKKPPSLLLRPPSSKPEDSDSANNNDDFCTTCGGTGVFICCDSCPKSFHLLCCDPPLREVPEDNWNCRECVAAQGMVPRKVFNDLGMFGRLINAVHGRNPAQFRLPKRLRDATFIGVSTGDDQSYTDDLIKPELSISKINAGQIAGFNKNEDLDIEALYDKSGSPYLCHKCRLSGLQRRTMVSCDFCPLKWHLDCLPGPVCSAKTLGQKWRCPNHAESILPSSWMERRSFKDTLVFDAAVHNNFLQFFQANNYLIKYRSQPYIKDDRIPSLQEYAQYEKRDFVSRNTDFLESWSNKFGDQNESENEDETAELEIPDFLQNYSIDGKIVARSSRKLAKVLLMTNADDPDQKPFIYRVPEQQLILDFMSKNKSKKKDILNCIEEYERHAEEERSCELEAVSALMKISDAPQKTPGSSASTSIEVEPEGEEQGMSSKGSRLDVHLNCGSKNGEMSSSEIAELRQIRKLIEMRGKDFLLDLLKS